MLLVSSVNPPLPIANDHSLPKYQHKLRGELYLHLQLTVVDSHTMYKGDLIGLKLQGMAEPISPWSWMNILKNCFWAVALSSMLHNSIQNTTLLLAIPYCCTWSKASLEFELQNNFTMIQKPKLLSCHYASFTSEIALCYVETWKLFTSSGRWMWVVRFKSFPCFPLHHSECGCYDV